MPDTAQADRKIRPLEGVRVLDIATYIAAPFAATILGEFGAEVIKVEMPQTGDLARKLGHKTEKGTSLLFLSEGRNKKSVTLNLKTPEGAALLKKLAAQSDILCENFQTGTLEGWGLGWETLHALNPRLIMLRVTGYGQTGPYKDKPGFGRVGAAFGGLSFLCGDPDGPPQSPGTATIADYASGMWGAMGALLALQARERTGEGQYIDIGLYESVFRLLDETVSAFDMFGHIRKRVGPGSLNSCPHNHFETGDGRWIAIACTNDKIFARLAALMGHPEWAGDGKYGTVAQRVAARHEVDAAVQDWCRRSTQQQVIALCEEAQVPCSMVSAIDEIFADPQYAARENIARVADERLGALAVPNVMPRLSATPGRIDHLGPELGQHNADILGGLLGLGPDEMQRLRESGVI